MEIYWDDDDLDVAVRTLFGEARNQLEEGKYRVAFVIRNRADWGDVAEDHPEREWWGNGVAAACQHPFQFSCWLPGKNLTAMTALQKNSEVYQSLAAICKTVFNGVGNESLAKDRKGNFLSHYKVSGSKASWDKEVITKGVMPVLSGAHSFYALGPS